LRPSGVWAVASTPVEQLVLILGARWGLRNDEIRHFNRTWWIATESAIQIPGACCCRRCDELFASEGVRWSPKSVCGERRLGVGCSPTSVALIEDFLRGNEGVYYSAWGIGRIVERLYARAHLPRPRAASREHYGMIVHGLRAAAAMRLALDLDNPMKLCAAMGWSNLVVARHYINVAQAQVLRVGPDLWEAPKAG
jgi:hypothetical protein